MASSSAGPSVDALSKLRIQRNTPRSQRTWLKWVVRAVATVFVLLVLAIVGLVLTGRTNFLSNPPSWLAVPEMIQSRVEVRLASVTVESGRSADATVVATGYVESRRQAR